MNQLDDYICTTESIAISICFLRTMKRQAKSSMPYFVICALTENVIKYGTSKE